MGFMGERKHMQTAAQLCFKFLQGAVLLGFFTVVFTVVDAKAVETPLPSSYTGLNDYVVMAPNQGDTKTCLFMASTGAMEILLNKHLNIRNPKVNGETDLSERYTISAPSSSRVRSWLENAVLKYDSGEGVLQRDMPYFSFTATGEINNAIWNRPPNFNTAPKVSLPKIETQLLFEVGNRYSRNVMDAIHLRKVKEALVREQSPVLISTNDTDYWHVVVVVGYDDNKEGDCYQLDHRVCEGKKGVILTRDSFGVGIEERSYEWFFRRVNAAAVVKLAR